MQTQEMEGYRNLLASLRDRLCGRVSQLSDETLRPQGGEASGSLSNAPLHMADMGTDCFEQELSFSLLESEEQTLDEVNQALERIDRGLFGKCEECTKFIPKARLQAVPFARHCVDCARKVQQSS